MPENHRERLSQPIPKPASVIDREAVWAELSDVWTRPEPALVFGLGRRRAGKSWVLARFARAVGGLYYQATKRTESEQLAALSQLVGAHFGDVALANGVAFPTWEALLTYVTERAASGPLLVVLDEFPYLAEAAPALPSILQHAWDHAWQGSQIKLVLNGSHITAMKQLEAADQPLYGRRTGRLRFPPFPAEQLRTFLPEANARDLLVAYGAFGGLPGHLALLRPDESVSENITRLMLNSSSRLADEAEHLLDAFRSDADIHYSIIHAIAAGDTTWSRITSRVGKPSGSLSRPMRWLEEMQIIARDAPITESADASRRTRYRLVDHYVAFWHRFVAPLIAAGESSLLAPGVLWASRVAPRIDDYMGPVFETVCRSWVARTSRLPFPAARVGAWWNAASTHEIDIVALGPERQLLVNECKWGRVDDADLTRLRARAALLQAELSAADRGGALHLACFSARGEWSDGVRREIETGAVLGFSGEDVLAL